MVLQVYQAYLHPLHWVSPVPNIQHLNGPPHRSGLWGWSLAAHSVLIVIPYRPLTIVV